MLRRQQCAFSGAKPSSQIRDSRRFVFADTTDTLRTHIETEALRRRSMQEKPRCILRCFITPNPKYCEVRMAGAILHPPTL